MTPRIVFSSPLPVLSLDAATAINIGKLRLGRRLNVRDQQRCEDLLGVLAPLLARYALAVAEPNIDEEYLASSEGPAICAALDELPTLLLASPQSIEGVQLARALKAFATSSSTIDLTAADWFQRNSLDGWHEIPRVLRSRMTVGTFKPADQVRLEELRAANRGRSYEEVRMGETFTLAYFAATRTPSDLLAFAFRETGITDTRNHRLAFASSSYCRALPTVDIQSRLFADLIAGDRAIEKGDSLDVDQLASVALLARFALVDGRVADRWKRLRLAERWPQTTVFGPSDWDRLLTCLRAL